MAPPLVVDYSFGRPSYASLHAAGVAGVIRYISNSGKGLTVQEAAAIRQAGFPLGLVLEDGARSVLGGAAAGDDAGRRAAAGRDAIGAPASTPVAFTYDFAPTAAEIEQGKPYFEAASKHVVPMAYGPYSVVEALVGTVAEFGWQTRMGSTFWVRGVEHVNLSHKAALFQHAPGQVWDDNDLYDPRALWEFTPTAPPPPLPPLPPFPSAVWQTAHKVPVFVPSGTPNLQAGMTNTKVEAMIDALKFASGVKLSGSIFTAQVYIAVVNFQKYMQIPVTGKYDERTAATLLAVVSLKK